MIERIQKGLIAHLIGGEKAIIIYGARQVGKSTLLHDLFGKLDRVLWLNGDDIDVQHLFDNISSTRLKALIGQNKYVVIDEAQRIPSIGLRLKLITDQIEGVQVIVTGSSSFQLAKGVQESLTGRKREFLLFPLTYEEMVNHTNLLDEHRMIPHRMVFGYYPEVVTSPGQEREVLHELANSYLYKDVLTLDQIGKSEKIVKLLQVLAYQIGDQVSYHELGQLIGLDPKTIEKYIQILEKNFIIFRLGSFSRNMRNELKMSRKIYFWDLGIRNAVIANFQQVENRMDSGALWENFVIAERLKYLNIHHPFTNSWFWRTQQQKEIDYLEERDGVLQATELKWNEKKANVKVPESFAKAYPQAHFQVITPERVDDFLLSD
ncbi:ATP-binding protein [Prevotella sp. AGR2160]|uniref:ATP-binding protein n=1 Tax=Prevotella sp. AGR2160 TaxID=1280674 RepID=UPI0003F5CFD4|nr:ATP-binding protein [Prevotella sp. AGR2160]